MSNINEISCERQRQVKFIILTILLTFPIFIIFIPLKIISRKYFIIESKAYFQSYIKSQLSVEFKFLGALLIKIKTYIFIALSKISMDFFEIT